jgi:thiol-disulfide isomerase/thioredoxin
MKRLLLLLLTCPFVALKAQQPTPLALEDKKMSDYLTTRKPVKLIIQLNYLPDTVQHVTVKYSETELGIGLSSTKYTELDKNGRAEVTLSDKLAFQQVWLTVGKYLYARVYVNNGLTVTVDVKKIPANGGYMIGDGVAYSGEDGQLNTAMNQSFLFKRKERKQLIRSFKDLCNTRKTYDETAFLFKVDSIRTQIGQIDDEFIASHPEYGWAIKNETTSELFDMLFEAYWSDRMPDDIIKPIINHQPFFTSTNGAIFYRYLNMYSLRYGQPGKTDWLEKALAVLDSLYTQQRSDIAKLFFLESERDTYANSYPLIIRSIKTGWCKRIATDELAKATANEKRIDSLFASSKKPENANIGTPLSQLPFNANLYQLDKTANVDEFILNLKSKFANKALIIDFWATWCLPCMADLPFSKAFHEENKDLPIEYIYLCTTNNATVDRWKNKIADLLLPGTHIFVDDMIMEKLRTAFNAEGGFPTYVVIDVKGKVNSKAITKMQTLDRAAVKKVAGF